MGELVHLHGSNGQPAEPMTWGVAADGNILICPECETRTDHVTSPGLGQPAVCDTCLRSKRT